MKIIQSKSCGMISTTLTVEWDLLTDKPIELVAESVEVILKKMLVAGKRLEEFEIPEVRKEWKRATRD